MLTIPEQVKRDLEEQKKLGVKGIDRAIAYLEANAKAIEEAYDDGCQIEEISEWCIKVSLHESVPA